MENEKLEDIKLTSTTWFVMMFVCTVICVAGAIDSSIDGVYYMWYLVIPFAVLTLISLVISIVSSRRLKKRQGKDYFSNKMYIEAFVEFVFPNLVKDKDKDLYIKNISDKNKQTNLWKKLCTGMDIDCIFHSLIWFLIFLLSVYVLFLQMKSDNESRMMYITTFSIISLVLLVVLICTISNIKKYPGAIFDYMMFEGIKFQELAKHFDKAEKIIHNVWISDEYLFALSKGKSYCFARKECSEMTISFSRLRFVMIIDGGYDCIILSSLTPFGFMKLKKMLKMQ